MKKLSLITLALAAALPLTACFAEAEEPTEDGQEELAGDQLPVEEAAEMSPELAALAPCGSSTDSAGTTRFRNCASTDQLVFIDLRVQRDRYQCVRRGTTAVLSTAWSVRATRVVANSCR
jgi:hypothetical protein